MSRPYCDAEYVDMVNIYLTSNYNAHEASREYARRFPNRRTPFPRVFRTTYQRFRESGTVSVSRNSGTARVSVTLEENVLSMVRRDPTMSTRRLALRYNTNQTAVWRILNREGLYPYHYQPVQELLLTDRSRRLEFCDWTIVNYYRDANFVKNILWTDEAQFTKDGVFNYHNFHYWSTQNPRLTRARGSQWQFSCNMWAGVLGNGFVGPYRLPNRLNGVEFVNFLDRDFMNFLEELPLSIRRDMYFQLDGAPCHSSRIARDWLDHQFPNRWIGRYGPVAWPPRSPDLNILDFYVWGTMKNLVYASEISTIEELIERIDDAANVVRMQLQNMDVSDAVLKRVRACREHDGGHFENFL